MINYGLTLLSNIFSNIKLTDMETCYKVFRTDLLKSIPVRSDRFGFEPEITMKCAKRKLRIYEVPISYHGRTYEEGKKIGWKDGLKALGVILHFWLVDDLYVQPYGRAFLNNLSGTPQYLSWITEIVRPFLGHIVLEVGAGIGNLAGRLMARRELYIAAESDPLYLHALNNRFLRTPNVQVVKLNPQNKADFEPFREKKVDTVLLLNVLEGVDKPEESLRTAAGLLIPGGRLVVLVPQGKSLFCKLDETLGHKQRFDRKELEQMLASVGLTVEHRGQLAKIGKLSWFLFGKLFGQKQISKLWLKLFDKTVWIWKRLEVLMPWSGLSLIVVAKAGTSHRPVQNPDLQT
jgi:SAM-dependent methyltransferase